MTTKLSGRLTEEAVREVRARRARGETYVQIATALNISPSTVYNIVKRKTWGALK